MKQPTPSNTITPATISWKEDTPHSGAFDDYYFSSEYGQEETDYNFIQRNKLPQRWRDLVDQPGAFFTVGETGFGSGLNLLCAWRLWLQQDFHHATLHFVSVDKYPVRKEDLRTIYQQWPTLQPYCDELLEKYPPLIPGLHTIELAGGRIRLSLLFDDAAIAYQQVLGQVDAWFLDGFTPSRNPDMWSSTLFTELARLSHQDTTFATFTAAGIVRKGLSQVGFTVNKHPGLGPKREICYGTFEQKPKLQQDEQAHTQNHKHKPWFRLPYANITPGTATVIGAGLAGASIARSLAIRGWQVTVIEKHSSPAQEGSGNPTGITFTKLSQYNNPQNRFYQMAYLYSTSLIQKLFSDSQYLQGETWNLNGVVRLAYCEKEKQEQQALVSSGLWPRDIAIPLDTQETTNLLGFESTRPSLWLKQGGWLRPADFVRLLLTHNNITTKYNSTVRHLTHKQHLSDHNTKRWHLETEDTHSSQVESLHSDIVVIANSFGASSLIQTEHLPLRSVRGQVSFVAATESTSHLKHAINYEGYTAPARQGAHCVGATFHPKRQDNTCLTEDHRTNLANLATGLPSFLTALGNPTASALPGRVGFRCQTPDYLPLVGPAPSLDHFLEDYARLRKGMLRDPFPVGTYHPGLYVSLAHGSRGITSAPFCAELLANMIMGEVISTDKQVLEAVHPARFLIRDIKRRKR